ncbi:HXK4-like protein [Mya arenaria]|uniref:Phosphotransferase n=1 Tax=Mya arenaria TaxID=6604 RepID=A0ABY7FNR1_MYAAR|nr:HXK4-like protein [Mya arenaria]
MHKQSPSSEKLSTSDLIAMMGSTPRASITPRGSMMQKQVQGLSVDQVQEALLGLLADASDTVIQDIITPFVRPHEDYVRIQQLLLENMERGLNPATHDHAPVQMYPTYVRDVPNGGETGQSLALEFGSHHLRIELVTLENGTCNLDSKNGFISEKLLKTGTAEQLFDFLASFVHRFLKQRDLLNTAEPLPMGFTFAFPCRRLALNRAVLTHWTKSVHVEGVEGQEVVALLEAAFKKKGEINIVVDAVVNDTVGTLLSGAFEDPTCAIGIILSKGVNACYMERLDRVGTWDGDQDPPLQVVIDTEWYGFGSDGCLDFFMNEYDRDLDEHAKSPGKGTYEKMISGEHLGELVRLVLAKLRDCDIMFQDHWSEELNTRGRFYTKYISESLSEEDIRFVHTRHVWEDLHLPQASEIECRVLHHFRLVAAPDRSGRGAALAAAVAERIKGGNLDPPVPMVNNSDGASGGADEKPEETPLVTQPEVKASEAIVGAALKDNDADNA